MNYSNFLYGNVVLIIMNLYILRRDSLVPQSCYVLNRPSFLLFRLYLCSQANNPFIATSRECEHVWMYRTAHTPTDWTDTCHAPASSLVQGQAGVDITVTKRMKNSDLFTTTIVIFLNVVFLKDTITASAARSDKMERGKKNQCCHFIVEVHKSIKISHIQQRVTLWTKTFS